MVKLKKLFKGKSPADHKNIFVDYASKLAKEKYEFIRMEKKISDQIKAGLKNKDPKYNKIRATKSFQSSN